MGRIRAIVMGLFGGFLLAGGLTYTMNAKAYTCCDPWGIPGATAFINAGNMVIGSITSATSTLANVIETSLLETISNGFGKAYAESSKQTAARKTLQEGMVKAQTQLYLEERRADALADIPKKEDLDQTVVNTYFLSEQGPIELVNRLDLGLAASDRTLYGTFQSGPYARYTRHERWCSPEARARDYCDDLAEVGLGDADGKFETVIGKETGLTLSDARREAAVDFALTIVGSDLRAQMTTNTPQAQEADALVLAEQAAMSVVTSVFLDMTAERTRRNQDGLPRDHHVGSKGGVKR